MREVIVDQGRLCAQLKQAVYCISWPLGRIHAWVFRLWRCVRTRQFPKTMECKSVKVFFSPSCGKGLWPVDLTTLPEHMRHMSETRGSTVLITECGLGLFLQHERGASARLRVKQTPYKLRSNMGSSHVMDKIPIILASIKSQRGLCVRCQFSERAL